MPTARTFAYDLAAKARAAAGQPMPRDVVIRHLGDRAFGLSVSRNCKGCGGVAHEHWTLSIKGDHDPFVDPFTLDVLTALGAPADVMKNGAYAMWTIGLSYP